jgi:hypothetical protein
MTKQKEQDSVAFAILAGELRSIRDTCNNEIANLRERCAVLERRITELEKIKAASVPELPYSEDEVTSKLEEFANLSKKMHEQIDHVLSVAVNGLDLNMFEPDFDVATGGLREIDGPESREDQRRVEQEEKNAI